MKDLYSFHATQEDLDAFYQKATEAYHRVYKRCGLDEITLLTYASGGIFSRYSHEFQTITPFGEDVVFGGRRVGIENVKLTIGFKLGMEGER